MYPDLTNYRLYNGEVMRGSAALITFTGDRFWMNPLRC